MIDLFSGIGGFALAASLVWGNEFNPVMFCEIDKFCQKVLIQVIRIELDADEGKCS